MRIRTSRITCESRCVSYILYYSFMPVETIIPDLESLSFSSKKFIIINFQKSYSTTGKPYVLRFLNSISRCILRSPEKLVLSASFLKTLTALGKSIVLPDINHFNRADIIHSTTSIVSYRKYLHRYALVTLDHYIDIYIFVWYSCLTGSNLSECYLESNTNDCGWSKIRWRTILGFRFGWQ